MIRILMEHVESKATMVLDFYPGEEEVPVRLQLAAAKKEGWLPKTAGGKIMVVTEARESNGGPAGFRTASAHLRP